MDLLDGKPIVVLIDDELIANRKTNRPYIHVVTLTKKNTKRMLRFPLQFLEIKISSPILKERLQRYYKIS